ncbi:MAG TPA: alpha/beta hydrolase-fold protein [Mucilaginibacter sp.]|jgi:esterase/lipase superfamily enzyme
MNREYHKWYSPWLQRDMELLVLGHGGRAVLFFPTRMARFYDYENWHVIDAVKDKVCAGELHFFCVDSVDIESFYNQQVLPIERITRHIQYEQYILKEVLKLMHEKNEGDYFEVAGCSMGAFHAVNLAFKHPTIFKKVVGMSGRYDLTKEIQDFKDLFDGFTNEDIYFNMPQQFVTNLDEPAILNAIKDIEIILAIGETDPFLKSNQEFSHLLSNKGIPNQLKIWAGYAHKPRHWRQMVELYL